ncbi:Xbp1p SCDLUD_002767 [Saccharomycodes ludwigii]|uniref:Xbp1p n=1 Tax=Saccharomycodes ludwigii TaxID=36035 RepID=UPI001E89B752|nr:hypothetical protein SCDLUD_002767 [Saccharomycodes ludwigii]KAH3901277.1 hypothetical protein SCDLUD_002767 [Saccharomycodes ludwigii]
MPNANGNNKNKNKIKIKSKHKKKNNNNTSDNDKTSCNYPIHLSPLNLNTNVTNNTENNHTTNYIYDLLNRDVFLFDNSQYYMENHKNNNTKLNYIKTKFKTQSASQFYKLSGISTNTDNVIKGDIPRNELHCFQYSIDGFIQNKSGDRFHSANPIIWDYETGYVFFTGIWRLYQDAIRHIMTLYVKKNSINVNNTKITSTQKDCHKAWLTFNSQIQKKLKSPFQIMNFGTNNVGTDSAPTELREPYAWKNYADINWNNAISSDLEEELLKLNHGDIDTVEVELNTLIQRIRGGLIKIQGSWLPFEICKELCSRFCYPIRYILTPIFGHDFVQICEQYQTQYTCDKDIYIASEILFGFRSSGCMTVSNNIKTINNSNHPALCAVDVNNNTKNLNSKRRLLGSNLTTHKNSIVRNAKNTKYSIVKPLVLPKLSPTIPKEWVDTVPNTFIKPHFYNSKKFRYKYNPIAANNYNAGSPNGTKRSVNNSASEVLMTRDVNSEILFPINFTRRSRSNLDAITTSNELWLKNKQNPIQLSQFSKHGTNTTNNNNYNYSINNNSRSDSFNSHNDTSLSIFANNTNTTLPYSAEIWTKPRVFQAMCYNNNNKVAIPIKQSNFNVNNPFIILPDSTNKK